MGYVEYMFFLKSKIFSKISSKFHAPKFDRTFVGATARQPIRLIEREHCTTVTTNQMVNRV